MGCAAIRASACAYILLRSRWRYASPSSSRARYCRDSRDLRTARLPAQSSTGKTASRSSRREFGRRQWVEVETAATEVNPAATATTVARVAARAAATVAAMAMVTTMVEAMVAVMVWAARAAATVAAVEGGGGDGGGQRRWRLWRINQQNDIRVSVR